MNAILHAKYGICPDELTDRQWFDLYASYKYVEELEFENQKLAFQAALAEIITQVVSKKNE